MILLDTNVFICASDSKSTHSRWAKRMIAEGVSGNGAAIDAVSLAEVCVGDAEPKNPTNAHESYSCMTSLSQI